MGERKNLEKKKGLNVFFRGIDELCIFVDAQIDYRKNSGKSLGVIGNWLYMK